MVMLEFNTLNDALIASAKTDQGIWFVTGFDEETFFSYAELLDNAKAYLAALQKYGVKPGDELVLQYSSLQQLIEAQWACLLGGIVPIPLEKGDKPDSGLKVLQVWQQLLGHSQISRQVSYFDVGGNSFSLMLMHNELDQIWPGLIQVTDIFANPTIAALADLVTERLAQRQTALYLPLALSAEFFDISANSSDQEGQLLVEPGASVSEQLHTLAQNNDVTMTDILIGLQGFFLHKRFEHNGLS